MFTFPIRECQKSHQQYEISPACVIRRGALFARQFVVFVDFRNFCPLQTEDRTQKKASKPRGTAFYVFFCTKSWIIVDRVAPVTRRRWGGRAIRIHSAFLNMIYDEDDEKPTASPLWCIDGIISIRFRLFSPPNSAARWVPEVCRVVVTSKIRFGFYAVYENGQ